MSSYETLHKFKNRSSSAKILVNQHGYMEVRRGYINKIIDNMKFCKKADKSVSSPLSRFIKLLKAYSKKYSFITYCNTYIQIRTQVDKLMNELFNRTKDHNKVSEILQKLQNIFDTSWQPDKKIKVQYKKSDSNPLF